jgi:hypothetical protein
MDKRTLDIAAYAASGMTPEQYKATGGYRNIFGEAGAMVGDNIIKFAKAQKILQQKQNNKIAQYMQSMNTSVDITSLNGQQQKAATDFLVSQKRMYADAAMQITSYDPTDDRYMELIDVMNGVNNRVKNFAGQVDSLKGMKEQFVKDVDSGLISDGNDVGKFAITTDALTNSSLFMVDDSGNIAFSNELGQVDLFKDLPSYFNKDFDTANQLTNLMETVYSAGQSIDSNKENILRMKLTNMISQGGRSTLLSLANDDFFVQGGLGIADPLLYEKENEEQLKEQVISGYIKALKDTAAQGAAKANQNNKAKPATRYQREMQQVENLFVNSQQSVVDNLTNLYQDAGEEGPTFESLFDISSQMGLDVTRVTNEDDDVIGYAFEHPLVDQVSYISTNSLISDPFLVQQALYRALGSDLLGVNVARPEAENETESDLPIIE